MFLPSYKDGMAFSINLLKEIDLKLTPALAAQGDFKSMYCMLNKNKYK